MAASPRSSTPPPLSGNDQAWWEASGVSGWGGLWFVAPSPAGAGRLVRLPFYPSTAPVPNGAAGTSVITTFGGDGVVSAVNPVFFTSCIVGFAGGTAYSVSTPVIAWARLRLVGFEFIQRSVANLVGNLDNTTLEDAEVGPAMIVSELKVGGSANLFTHPAWADARLYDADFPEFVGLRDYPIIERPNQVTVSVNQVGVIDASLFPLFATYRSTVSCSVLCEVLVDDDYGTHLPGPFARTGALMRVPPRKALR